MIAKRVVASKHTSSIQRLVSYIANPTKQQEIKQTGGGVKALSAYMDKPKAVVRISNCGFETIDAAVWEIQATQKKNTRSQNNKTYHLVASFREGEKPSPEVLAAVEDKIANRLGFAEHQRISALHTDTNNWHLHVAINKVHPSTYRNVEPLKDYLKMQEACRELEKEFGLLVDNGVKSNKQTPMNPAQDKEAHTGIKSLVSWIREKAVTEIKNVLVGDDPDWPTLHKVLNRYGLTIRQRGAGFVIQDITSGLTVKASSVDRSFSKKKIENILGEYRKPKITHTASEQYQAGPVQAATHKRNKFWEQYEKERNKTRFARIEELKIISDQRRKYLQNIFADIKKRKKIIREKNWLSWRYKKDVYAALQVERLKALEIAGIVYQQRRDLINTRFSSLTWTAFLQREAENGNTEAVKLLREKKGKSIHDQADYLERLGANNTPIYQDMKYRVDKRGRITYQLDRGWVLDTGQRVQPGSLDYNVLIATLQIASGKYGRKLRVQGSQEFLKAIKKAAYDRRLDLSINGKDILVNRRGQQKNVVER